jgi:hypothetical protein
LMNLLTFFVFILVKTIVVASTTQVITALMAIAAVIFIV